MMIVPGEYDMLVVNGASFSLPITWVNTDLTGCSIECQLRQNQSSSDVEITLSTENGKIVLADQVATPGLFTLTMTASDTEDLETGVYDVKITAADAITVNRLLGGQVVVSPPVTR